MTQVSGSLKLVTGSPAAVSQVWLRAPNGRVQGTEYVTEAPDTVQVTGGAVSFDALPGALMMTLVAHGAPMHTVKLLVPDKTSATLAECIEAAELATDGTRSALERLALEVQAELGQVPSLVSDALAQDSTIIDAVEQASTDTLGTKADKTYVDTELGAKADKTYVDEADQALGQRIDAEKAPLVHEHTTAQITDLHHYSGTGFPEGKVTAPVGATYTDTAATNGAIRWIKVSGTGNTGWRVEYGDTGWRDITALMEPSAPLAMGEGAKVAIRRKDSSVFFRMVGPATMTGTFGNIVSAHSGLRPDLDTMSPAARGASFRNTRVGIRLEDGTRDVLLVNSGRAVETMWSTVEAWPTTLPGTPL